MDSTMFKGLVASTLKQVIGKHNPPTGVIYHFDRGSQCAIYKYQKLLRKHGSY